MTPGKAAGESGFGGLMAAPAELRPAIAANGTVAIGLDPLGTDEMMGSLKSHLKPPK